MTVSRFSRPRCRQALLAGCLLALALPCGCNASGACAQAPPLRLAQAQGSAERIAVSASEMERLGIRLASPERTERVPMAQMSAVVTVPPASEHVVAAATAGLLSRLLVAPGDRVSAGEVIAEIDSPELVALQVELLDALSRQRLARNRLNRDSALYEDGIIPERRLEQTRRDDEEAGHRLALARQRLALAGLDARDLAALESSRELSPRLSVRSPIAGTVLEQYESPGARLHAADPIVRVADLSRLWLVLQAPPAQLRRIRPGQLVVPSTRPDQPIARVQTPGAVLDPDTQTIPVRAVMLRETQGYGAGEFLSVQVLEEAGQEQVWALPGAAVVREGSRDVVFVREGEGFRVQPVTLVREDADRTLVAGGLDTGMRIAISGTATLKALWQQ